VNLAPDQESERHGHQERPEAGGQPHDIGSELHQARVHQPPPSQRWLYLLALWLSMITFN
jgi:hypothetical protein